MEARKRQADVTAEELSGGATSNQAEITPLGAGNEVGRSCIMYQYQGKSVMFDCGIHPGYSGINSLPYLDEVDLTKVDVALITHFHLDHCAAVPYLLTKTKFKGRIFMTHSTKVIYNSLLRDFARLNKGSAPDEQLYTEEDIDASMDRIEVVDFQQTLSVNDILITPYRAGHVLGAAMFMVEIAGMKCLYTGDYSRIPDRHLPGADIPNVKPDVVIIESTYGVSKHLPREERERHFLNRIHSTIAKEGRVLLPVVALGRAQELLLMLDEYWDTNPELQKVPIYQASGMMRRAMTVYQTYVEMMNDDIKRAFQDHNPFDFRHVTHLNNTRHFDDIGPCVMMATPSGLQSGVSRDVFDTWCDDPRNAVILCDFAVQGTLAREILGGPSQVLTKQGIKKPLRCAVDHISFSAHADFDQTSGFLDTLQPPHVVLVHGEVTEMGRLKNALERGAEALSVVRNVFMPRNNQTVLIEHRPLRIVRLMGRLAEKPPKEGQPARGVLVSIGGSSTANMQLLHPDDLPAFTKLYKGRVTQRQAIQINKPFADIRLALEVMFEGVGGEGVHPVRGNGPPPHKSAKMDGGRESTPELMPDATSVTVGEHVTVTYLFPSPEEELGAHVMVEWEGSRVGDMVADAVVAVLLQAAGEPEAASSAEDARRRAMRSGDVDALAAAELQLVAALMRSQFGPTTCDALEGRVNVMVDSTPVEITYADGEGKVSCSDTALQARVDKALQRVIEAMRPCPLDYDHQHHYTNQGVGTTSLADIAE